MYNYVGGMLCLRQEPLRCYYNWWENSKYKCKYFWANHYSTDMDVHVHVWYVYKSKGNVYTSRGHREKKGYAWFDPKNNMQSCYPYKCINISLEWLCTKLVYYFNGYFLSHTRVQCMIHDVLCQIYVHRSNVLERYFLCPLVCTCKVEHMRMHGSRWCI